MLFLVFFIEFDLYMTLECTSPQHSGTPNRVTLSTQLCRPKFAAIQGIFPHYLVTFGIQF